MILTIGGAALLLHCSVSHVSRAIRGQLRNLPTLPSFRLGRRVLIREQALKGWLLMLERREEEALRVAGVCYPKDDEWDFIAGA